MIDLSIFCLIKNIFQNSSLTLKNLFNRVEKILKRVSSEKELTAMGRKCLTTRRFKGTRLVVMAAKNVVSSR